MKKYFKYEFKRYLVLGLLIIVIMTSINLYITATARVAGDWWLIRPRVYTQFPIISLVVLTFIVPYFIFKFRFEPRTIDCLYILPIKRENIYLTKLIISAIIVSTAFTVAYWLGVIVLAARGADYFYIYFLFQYITVLLSALSLMVVVTYVYTRANNIFDGIFFSILVPCIPMLIMLPFTRLRIVGYQFVYSIMNLSNFSPIINLTDVFNRLIISGRNSTLSASAIVTIILWFIAGIVAALLLINSACQQKVEDAGGISNSLWGYQVLNPILIFSITALIVSSGFHLLTTLFFIFILSGSYLLYVLFRRTLFIKSRDLIILATTLISSFILGVILTTDIISIAPAIFLLT